MKGFFQSSNRMYCLSNIFVCILCTSYLCTGFYQVNNNNQHEKDTVIIDTETDPLSESKEEEVVSKKTVTKTVVTKAKTNTSSKTYIRPKYDSVTGSAVVDYAKKYIGLRYISGGNSLTTGTDCSGFTKLIYQQFGIKLSRSVKTQAKNGAYVSKSDLQKGDLIFYGRKAGVVSHVAIYIGGGKVIHQSTPKSGVKIGGMNMMVYITARRVITKKSSNVVEEKSVGDVAPTVSENQASVADTYTNGEYNKVVDSLPVENGDVKEELITEPKIEQNVEENKEPVVEEKKETYTNSEYGTSN